jgi:hypothetical protein
MHLEFQICKDRMWKLCVFRYRFHLFQTCFLHVHLELAVSLIQLLRYFLCFRQNIMRSLHDVHKMKAYGAGHVCLSA